MGIAHWDEVARRRNVRGVMAATWSDLGGAAGTYRCGVRRIEMGPGEQPTPAHVHGASEEIFYVLAGSGLTWLDEKAYELREGDCVVYKNFHEAHTLRGGDGGLDVLAFGPREYLPAGSLPRARLMWGITGVIEEPPWQELHPWDREPPIEWPEPERERPPTIVNVAAVEPTTHEGRRRRDLARAAGSRWTGLKHVEAPPGTLTAVPHCHSAEEEIFVVLDGEGTLELYTSDARLAETHAVRRGSVVTRPPGTGVAHTFRAGGDGLTLLAWGTREPHDVTWYPRSRKLSWGGVNVIGRIERLDYWDGESLT
jgi:uncharacterized cupin superfamily protein